MSTPIADRQSTYMKALPPIRRELALPRILALPPILVKAPLPTPINSVTTSDVNDEVEQPHRMVDRASTSQSEIVLHEQTAQIGSPSSGIVTTGMMETVGGDGLLPSPTGEQRQPIPRIDELPSGRLVWAGVTPRVESPHVVPSIHVKSSSAWPKDDTASLHAQMAALKKQVQWMQRVGLFVILLALFGVALGAAWVVTRGDKVTSSQLAYGAVQTSSLGDGVVTPAKLSADVTSTLDVAFRLNNTMTPISSSAAANGGTGQTGVAFGSAIADFIFARPSAPQFKSATDTIIQGQTAGTDSTGGTLSLQGGPGSSSEIRLQAVLPVSDSSNSTAVGARRRMLSYGNTNSNGNSATTVLSVKSDSASSTTSVAVTATNASISAQGQGSTLSLTSENGHVQICAGGCQGSTTSTTNSTSGNTNSANGNGNGNGGSSSSSSDMSGSITLTTGGGSAVSAAQHQNGNGCDDAIFFPSLAASETNLPPGCSGTAGNSNGGNNSTSSAAASGSTSSSSTGAASSAFASPAPSNSSHIILSSGDGVEVSAVSQVIVGSRLNDTTVVAPKGTVSVSGGAVSIRSTNSTVKIYSGDNNCDDDSQNDPTHVIVQGVHFNDDTSITNVSVLHADQVQVRSVSRLVTDVQGSSTSWDGGVSELKNSLSLLPVLTAGVSRISFTCNHSYIWLPSSNNDNNNGDTSLDFDATFSVYLQGTNPYYWWLLAPANGTVNGQNCIHVSPAVNAVQCWSTSSTPLQHICHVFDDDGQTGATSQTLLSQLQQQSTSITNLTAFITQLQLLTSGLLTRLSVLESSVNSSISSLAANIHSVNASSALNADVLYSQLSTIQAQVNTCATTITCNSTVDDQTADNAAMVTVINNVATLTSELHTINTTIEAHLTSVNNTITTITNQLSTLQTQIQTDDTSILNLQTSVIANTASIATLNSQVQTTNTGLLDEMTTVESIVAALQTSVVGLLDQMTVATVNITQLQQETIINQANIINQFNSQLSSINASVASQDISVATTTINMVNLQHQMTNVNTNCGSVNQSLNQFISIISTNTSQIQRQLIMLSGTVANLSREFVNPIIPIADLVYGQLSLSTSTAGVSASSLSHPDGSALDSSNNLYVADSINNRVLRYPSGSTIASGVYGQVGSFATNTANNGGVSASSLYYPNGLALDSSNNLYVADSINNRVLRYPSGSPIATGVYGQVGSFTTNTANNGGVSANSLCYPYGLALDSSNSLYVADSGNNRVLYYPAGSTVATVVYGQLGSFTTSNLNNGGVSANSLYTPRGLALDSSNNLYVADMQNNRVLYYPAGSNVATVVYGQSGLFLTNTEGLADRYLGEPYGVTVSRNGTVFVVDSLNNRVLRFPPLLP